MPPWCVISRQAPTLDELRRLMKLLGIDDPRAMMRTGESVYGELGLSDRIGRNSSWRRSPSIRFCWSDRSSCSANGP